MSLNAISGANAIRLSKQNQEDQLSIGIIAEQSVSIPLIEEQSVFAFKKNTVHEEFSKKILIHPLPLNDRAAELQFVKRNEPEKPPSNDLAIISFVLGIGAVLLLFSFLVFFPALALPALILGIIALHKIKKYPEKYRGKGFAISAVVLGILPFLAIGLFYLLLALGVIF